MLFKLLLEILLKNILTLNNNKKSRLQQGKIGKNIKMFKLFLHVATLVPQLRKFIRVGRLKKYLFFCCLNFE